MVRSVTTFDEDFTEDDMQAALEWQVEDALTCSCGQPIDESTAVGADDDYEAELLVCHACAAMDRKERIFRESQSPVTDGLKRRAHRVED